MSEKTVVIIKNLKLEEIWRYDAKIIYRKANIQKIAAYFNREDRLLCGVKLKHNDLFVETFYSDKWYNIFEIYDRDDQKFKGWYCNICLPAQFEEISISYVDLAIDLFVLPEGKQFVLDLDEFEDLNFDEETKKKALNALKRLRKHKFKQSRPGYL